MRKPKIEAVPGTPALVAVIVTLQYAKLLVPEDAVTSVVEAGHDETRPLESFRINLEIQANNQLDSRSGEKAC